MALALALFGACGLARISALLFCYLAALIVFELPWLRRVSARGDSALLFVALALPGIMFGYRARAKLIDAEQWMGLATRLSDRVRLERTPAIAPPLVRTDRPQTFFIHAPGAKVVALWFGGRSQRRPAESLGDGLFRVDYDPRRHGVPAVGDGVFDAAISVDGEVHARAMIAATPLAHPRWFCSSPDGTHAAVPSEETDELLIVGENTPVERIAVGDGPSACAFLDDGTLAVTQRWSSALWVLAPADARAPRSVQLAGPLGELVFDAQAGRIIVARGGHAPALLSISWPELELRGTTPLQAAVDHLLLGPRAGELITATRADASLRLLRRSGETYVAERELHLGRAAAALARSRDGRRVYATVTDYRPDRSPQLGNHFVQDQLLVVDAEALQVRSRVFTARRSERQTKPGDVDQGGSPLGLFELRDGRLAMTMAGTDELWRYAWGSDAIDAVQLRDSDVFTPHGVVELADGTLWLSSPAASTLARLRAGEQAPTVVSLAPAKLSHEARLRRKGERAFYQSTRSGISCQSCHMHAGSDDAAYNLGDHRLVPTLTVAGVAGTAPYLRDGSYPRIEDLDEVAEKLYRGYDRILPGRRAALQAFIEGLPRERTDVARDRDAEKRGLRAFMKARCERCHTPPAFTNLAQLPMASVFPTAAKKFPDDEVVDVPSLLSVSTSPPYLNDGRAETLSAVLDDQNPDNLHGDTRALSPAERADLIAFLRSL
jgi:hypothetical protein